MSDDLVIRPARDDELVAVGELTLDGYVHDGFLTRDDGYSAHLLDADQRARDAELVVAVRSGEVVGTVTFCPPDSPMREVSADGEGEFRMLAVSPTARGLGIGRALVLHCVDRCQELGLTGLAICSMSRMTAAHRLYDATGFVRDSSLDWEPEPGVLLWGFRRPV